MYYETINDLIDIVRRQTNLIDRLYLILAQHQIADCAGDLEKEIFEVANKIESIDGGL